MREPHVESPVEQVEEAREEGTERPSEASEADLRIAELEAQLQQVTVDRDKLQDQLLRTLADFQNARKRAQQEVDTIRQFATERLVTQLLPVLDNFERTIAAMEAGADVDAVADGIRAVDKQFRTVLEGVAVKRIEAHGQPFDPEMHEAIALEASTDHPADTVIDEVEAGYRMADKVIRPARVRVAKKP